MLEVGHNLLGVSTGLAFKVLDTIRVTCLKPLLDFFHIPPEIIHVGLLVEYSTFESEGADDVINLRGSVFKGLLLLLGGRVGT